MGRTPPDIAPFEIAVPDATLNDLERRLRSARFPPDFLNEDWSYGVPTSYLRELVAYWLEQFDWREHERAMNALPQWRVELDGIPIHFIHLPSPVPGSIPLILTHGWP